MARGTGRGTGRAVRGHDNPPADDDMTCTAQITAKARRTGACARGRSARAGTFRPGYFFGVNFHVTVPLGAPARLQTWMVTFCAFLYFRLTSSCAVPPSEPLLTAPSGSSSHRSQSPAPAGSGASTTTLSTP